MLCHVLFLHLCFQVLLKSSVTSATMIYATSAVMAAVACLLLPIETRGKELMDSVQKGVNSSGSEESNKKY